MAFSVADWMVSELIGSQSAVSTLSNTSVHPGIDVLH